MTDYKKYINALRKCAKEHENDNTFTGHIIISDLCRDTANLLESLEEEPVLDKIKAEIRKDRMVIALKYDSIITGTDYVCEIIDKYGKGQNEV